MKRESCDVLVVGAGPAGLAAAIQLLRFGAGSVVLMDKGRPLGKRGCPALLSGECIECPTCSVLTGVGGASGMLGGKLCFFPAGERIAKHTGYSSTQTNERLLAFLTQIDFTLEYHLPGNVVRPGSYHSIDRVTLKDYEAIPLLSDDMRRLFNCMVNAVLSRGGIVRTGAGVVDISTGSGDYKFDVTYDYRGERTNISVRDSVVLATGRSGANWLASLLRRLGLVTLPETVDVGIRLQVPTECFLNLDPRLQDPKLKIYEETANEVRTLCWCRGGQLSLTRAEETTLVDGHFANEFGPFAGVSIVARLPIPSGFTGIDYSISQFVGFGHGPVVMHQKLADFVQRRNLRKMTSLGKGTSVPFRYRQVDIGRLMLRPLKHRILEMIEALDRLVEGRLLSKVSGNVYAPVIDKFWETPSLDRNLMTSIEGLYVAGDSTGLGRGILQGVFSGVVVADSIVQQDFSYMLKTDEASLSCGVF